MGIHTISSGMMAGNTRVHMLLQQQQHESVCHCEPTAQCHTAVRMGSALRAGVQGDGRAGAGVGQAAQDDHCQVHHRRRRGEDLAPPGLRCVPIVRYPQLWEALQKRL